MKLTPYWYQQEAIDATMKFLFEEKGNGTLDLPTGAGKSLILSELSYLIHQVAPTMKVVNLVDITGLIGQNLEALNNQYNDLHTSIYSASYNKKNLEGDIVFCGIQSVYKDAAKLGNVSVVIIDEIHRSSLTKDSMYFRFISELKKNNPHLRIIGLSGTPWKMEGTIVGSWICDKIIYKVSMDTLFDEGFLTPLITPEVSLSARTEDIKIGSSGEYNEKSMMEIMSDGTLIDAAIRDALQYAKGRKSWLVFASGKKHAFAIKEKMTEHGVESEVIIGDTETKERTEIIGRFNRQELKCLISVGVLSTGFNSKVADLAIILRAMQSTSLWIQILGRLLRTSPETGKVDALVLDYGSHHTRFPPINKIGPPPSKEEVKQAKRTPFKQCFSCEELIPYLDKECFKCGAVFGNEDATPNHGTEASTADIVARKRVYKELEVDDVVIRRHSSRVKGNEGNDSMLRVTFLSGLHVIHEYYKPNKEGWERNRFITFWNRHAHNQVTHSAPKSLDAVMTELNVFGIKKPKIINVDFTDVKVKGATTYGHKVVDYIF